MSPDRRCDDPCAGAVLATAGLAVGYRRRRATTLVLESGPLALAPGQVAVLLGPNGAGKSTLLRTLAGSQAPLDGRVVLGGEPLDRLSLHEVATRRSVVLTDSPDIGMLRARDLVGLGRYPHTGWAGRMTDHDHRVVEASLAAAGAEHLADRSIDRLSDGERQRVMIARALAQEPQLLLLDEPTAFLDIGARFELMGLLRQLADDGLSVVLATHELELALAHADLVWLVDGHRQLIATTPAAVVADGHIAAVFGLKAAELAERSLASARAEGSAVS